MASRNRTPLLGILIEVVLAAVNSGCGGSDTSSVPPPAINITPATVTVQSGTTQQFTATIETGSSSEGVTWTLSCSSTPCGAVSPTSTASGAATTYTPPVALPATNLSVTLTATSVADSTKFASASATIPQIPGFVGVNEVHVDSVNGMARLIINGNPVPPLIFTYQEDFPNNAQFLAPEVQDAAAAGIHLYSVSPIFPWDNGGTAPLDFSATDQYLDNILNVDPQAVFLLQIGVWPGPGWIPPVPPTSADQILYLSGPTTDVYHMSMASDIYFNGFLTSLPHLIQHFETSSYAAHLLGYKFCGGNTCEWFPVDMYPSGIDYSPVNTQKFQAWLLNKYGTDAALSAAWGFPVTISTAQVPLAASNRFPLQSVIGQTPPPPIDTFYQIPAEQDWIDFSAFTADLFSQRILAIASLTRTQTNGKRLIGFYNGYQTELAASFNGHERYDLLLASPDIDFICAPMGYQPLQERLVGGSGPPQSVIDSVAAHGKLWFDENDLATYLSAPGQWYATTDLTQTVDVLQRDMASILIHRAGTWWMDIQENGAFNDPAIWTPMSQYGIPLFNQLYANPQPYHPDVSLIVDRTSIFYEKNDLDAPIEQRALLRDILPRTSVASGIYSLDDFVVGTSPTSQVYIFANAFYLTSSQISTIQTRLNAEGSTAIWQYAPGFLGPSGPDVSQASSLTGIQLSESDGYGYTNGTGLMAGYNWGFTTQNLLSPRLVVTDPNAEVLGYYQSDNQVSSARKKVGNFESIFTGEFTLGDFLNFCWQCASSTLPSANTLRALLQTTGVHIWSTAGDVVLTDGNLLVIHAAAAGPDTISLPAGVSATPLGGGSPSTGTLNLTFSRVGETLWFQLSQSSQPAKSPARRRSK